jgi:hypothetical protein
LGGRGSRRSLRAACAALLVASVAVLAFAAPALAGPAGSGTGRAHLAPVPGTARVTGRPVLRSTPAVARAAGQRWSAGSAPGHGSPRDWLAAEDRSERALVREGGDGAGVGPRSAACPPRTGPAGAVVPADVTWPDPAAVLRAAGRGPPPAR